jgi:hypothetical protein
MSWGLIEVFNPPPLTRLLRDQTFTENLSAVSPTADSETVCNRECHTHDSSHLLRWLYRW